MSSVLRTLRPYLAPEWPALALATLSTLAVVAAWLARPLPIALVVDRLLGQRQIPFELDASDWRFVALVGGLVLAITVVGAAGAHFADDRLAKAGEHITHRLRVATYAQLQRLSLTFHEARQAGELVTRVTGDVSAVGGLFPGALGNLVSATTLLTGMLVVSLIIDPLLAVVAFAAAPALAFLSFRYRGRVKAVARRQRAKESEIAALSEESFSAMRVVKALGAERFEEERLRLRSEELRDLELEANEVEGRFSGITDLLGAVALALVLVVGVLRVAAGAVTPGELVVMWTYARRIDRPLRAIARNGNRLARGLTRAERVAEILAADEFLEERPGAYAGPRATGDLELHEVSFSYDPERPALVDLTLNVPAGERLALVGRSGAGKSTLAALIARFYDPPPDRGRVSLDGRDLRDCSLSWLRDQVGLVLQDTVLFTGTVSENIAYGLDADREQVVAASKAAGAHTFVAELPHGYDTMVGQRGVGLSGGQRQRIAIARTLLRNPPVLVLDEPTTGLDAESETQVMEGLGALMRGRTTILITHSERLAASADRVVVVDAGRVARDGPPELVLGEEQIIRGRSSGRAELALVPADPALPHMAEVLDPDVMAEVLARSLGEDAPPPDVRVRYLRYKPRTNLVVHYVVGIGARRHHATAMIARSDLGRRARKSENVALADMIDGRSPAAKPLSYEPALGALVQWLPLDLALSALAVPPAQRDQHLRSAGLRVDVPGEEPSLLAYKPRRRAVVRLDRYVLKYYANHARFAAATAGLRAAAAPPSVRAPTFEAGVPDLLVTVQSFVPGPDFGSSAAAAAEAGAALARLHSGGGGELHEFPPAEQLEAAAASARLVGWILPGLGSRLETLLARLEAGLPAGLEHVRAHGDFHARQLVDAPGGLVVTDFDGMRAAPRALDVATYTAHLVRGGPADLDGALAELESLLEGYGERPEGLSWYLATMILRRSATPFRYQEEHWPERVEEMVAGAERASR